MSSVTFNSSADLTRAMRTIVEARYPGRLSAEQNARLEKRVASLAEAIDRLRSYRLSNADEPDATFRAGEE